jgi:type II secretory pathway pseudopilin PulG
MPFSRRTPGFTIIEAVVAIALTALAASAVLLGTVSSLETTKFSQEQAIATGMAQQLMDEIVGTGYVDDSGNPYAVPIQPGTNDVSGVSRRLFTNIGDFNGYQAMPPVDSWGIPLGTEDGNGSTRNPNFQAPAGPFSRWQQAVSVSYVSETNLTTALTASQTSDYRAVTVQINYVDPATGNTRQLAQLRRVVAYVPALQ